MHTTELTFHNAVTPPPNEAIAALAELPPQERLQANVDRLLESVPLDPQSSAPQQMTNVYVNGGKEMIHITKTYHSDWTSPADIAPDTTRTLQFRYFNRRGTPKKDIQINIASGHVRVCDLEANLYFPQDHPMRIYSTGLRELTEEDEDRNKTFTELSKQLEQSTTERPAGRLAKALGKKSTKAAGAAT